MTHRYNKGFTIIETMMVLSITAVMVVALLVGVSANINSQRYRDSVNGLKSLIQEQFSGTINVQNEIKTDKISCDVNANITSTNTTIPRGQSDCVLMGRYIEIDNDKVTTSSVVGAYDSTNSSNLGDVDLLKSTKMSILASSSELSSLEWGASMTWPTSGPGKQSTSKAKTLYILILRSPSSGSVYLFNSDTKVPFASMIINKDLTPGRAEQTICVDSSGLVIGNGLSVYINANATTASDVQFRSNDEGGDTQC